MESTVCPDMKFKNRSKDPVMNNKKIVRARGNAEDSEENLRGRLRELQKQLEAEKRYSRSLEKRVNKLLGHKSEEEKAKESVPERNEPKNLCPHCGKEDTVNLHKVWSPTGEIVWSICSICHNRERIK